MADEPRLVGIEDFVKWTLGLPKVTRTLKKVVLEPWSFSGISDNLAAHMMRSAFYASLISDEGRWPKVALSACRPKPRPTIALFNPPVTADAVSIAKLAHAVTPSCRLGCAEIDGSPRLIGIFPSMGFGLGTFITRRDRSSPPQRGLIPSFKVTIRGPGHIDVLCDRGAFSYRSGQVESYSSILSSRALARLAAVMDRRLTLLLGREFASKTDADAEHRLARVQEPALGELLRKGLPIGELLRKGVKADVATDFRIQLTIAELVWRIAELGHGGMLIVTDRPESPALSYRYPISQRRLQKAMVRYWHAADEDGHGTSRIPLERSPGIPSVHEGLSLREHIAATAQLAATDGAIVLGSDFSLHGFGAMIDNAPADETQLKFLDGNDGIISHRCVLENKGMRHQSALSFVMREEGAVVFVVSQDGPIMVLENQGGAVRCEKGLRAEGL
jgi:hypothetical protein